LAENPQLALRVAQGLLVSAPGGTHGQAIPWLRKLAGEAQPALGQVDEATASLEFAYQGAQARTRRPALWQSQRCPTRFHLVRRAPEPAYAHIGCNGLYPPVGQHA
jgi:hypothetical protein